jgi:DNA-binding SARP family transcriptional activator/tetratricopeptide (TPR) repeat protein
MSSTPSPPPLLLFGVPSWNAEGRAPIGFVAERRFQLLALLACRGSWISRDELSELFWPERAGSVARSNLRKVLLLAQRVIAAAEDKWPIEQQRDLLRWVPDCDLQRFYGASTQGRVDEVLRQHAAPLLLGLDAGLPCAALDWLAFERQRAANVWRDAAARKFAQLSANAAHDAAASLAEEVLRRDPLDEEAVRVLATASLELQQPWRAERALRSHGEALATQLGLEPAVALRDLSARLRAQPSSIGPSAAPRVPLEAPAQSEQAQELFVGRRLEIGQLLALTEQQNCRALTLTGPGGIGKTSLLRAALPALLERYGKVVHWISLEDLTELQQAARRVAAQVGLELAAADDPWKQLQVHIGSSAVVLLLDNSEHLEGLDQALAALLAACPKLKIVTTSRARLSIPEEWVLPIDGLPLPDADETDADVLMHCDSVRLFVAGAAAVSRTFDLRTQARDVVRLVHFVEGMPLALLLASAWVRLLPVREIVAELANSLDLLDTGTPPSKATRRDAGLRASFRHSWNLLSVVERTSLAALAQLPGSFGREMAAQVANTSLPVLAALADKSLVRADGEGRFSLHPLIRQCAGETTGEIDLDVDELHRRHAAYLGRWLFQYRERRALSKLALQTIELELPHVRLAWARAVATGDPEFVALAGSTMMFFFELRAMWAEGLELMGRSASVFDDSVPAHRRAVEISLRALSRYQYRIGQLAQAERTARRGLLLARRIGEYVGVKAHLNTIGIVQWMQGNYAQARPFFAQALRHAIQDGDQRDITGFRTNLALLDHSLGRYEDARRQVEEVLPSVRRGDDPFALVTLLTVLSEVHLAERRWEAAIDSASESLALTDKHGFTATRAEALVLLGRARHGAGRLQEAHAALDMAIAQVRTSSESVAGAEAMLAQALVATDLGDPKAARDWLREAVQTARSVGSADLQLKCVLAHGYRLASAGDLARALASWRWASAQPGLQAYEREAAQRRIAELERARAVPDRELERRLGSATLAEVIDMIALDQNE